MNHNLLTIKQAAELGYASKPALKQACQRGRIDAFKLGRDWAFTADALSAAGYTRQSQTESQINQPQ